MVEKDTLFLYEEIMLLALQDHKGIVHPSINYPYALGGAILAELMLQQRIAVEEVKKNKKLVNLLNPKPVKDPLIDECLAKLESAKRRGSPQTWVARFAAVKNLKYRAVEGLCRKGILRDDEDKVLLIFTRKIYPEINPEPERKMIERLRRAVFTETREIDPRTVVLLSLANAIGLLRVAFDKKKLKARKDRIERIVNGEMTGKAAKEAAQAAQAAAMAAVMVACITSVVITATR